MDTGDPQAARTDVPRNGAVRARTPRRAKGDAGSALIELAMLLPFLAVIIFGTVDLGRAFALRNRLTNMAREGAFYAQYHPYNITGCTDTVENAARREDPGVVNPAVAVTSASGTALSNSCDAPGVAGMRVRVRVSTQLRLYTPFASAVMGTTITVASTTDVVVQG